jgi:hypothetical protein
MKLRSKKRNHKAQKRTVELTSRDLARVHGGKKATKKISKDPQQIALLSLSV